MRPIPTSLFSINTEDKVFVTEVSDIEANGFALNDTITLLSDLGNTAVFEAVETERDDEGDICSWRFAPTRQALAANSRLEGWSVTVFND